MLHLNNVNTLLATTVKAYQKTIGNSTNSKSIRYSANVAMGLIVMLRDYYLHVSRENTSNCHGTHAEFK